MVDMITDFKEKKLVEYLTNGAKVLIRFGHGFGDTQMFMPVFERLRELYSKVHFDLYLECGQEEIFESYPNKDSEEHDLIFSLDFPMAEGTEFTKSQKCCVDEIGIEPISETVVLPKKESPFVAIHLQGTALPDSVGCPQNIAEAIWFEVIEFGKIPIECHFHHVFHNPVNVKHNVIDRHVRNCKASLDNLIGLIQSSHAFIGVASGPLITALSVFPEKVLYLEKLHKLKAYTKINVSTINLLIPYKEGTVSAWLKGLG